MKKLLAILACVALLACLLTISVSAAETAGVVVTADKTDVIPGDTITYTVTLTNAALVDGGVWNFEYYLNIPEGLTLVDGAPVDATVFMLNTFNKDAKMGTSMGRLGTGYVGEDLVLAQFTCTVNEGVEGELTVSTFGVVITDKNGVALEGETGSAKVTSTIPHVCAPEAVAEVPATCTTEGVKAHSKCACGKLYIDGVEVTAADLVIPKAAHEMGEFAVTMAPTCTEKGVETSECANCDYTESREVAAKGHEMGEFTVTTAPTCTEKGVETSACANCEHTETREIAAKGHEMGEFAVTTAPTCTEKGVETAACANCDYTETREVEAKGHEMGEFAVTTAPTCTEKGVETAACANCEHTETREVEALGHDFVDGKCTRCGADDPNPATADTILAVLAVTVIAGMGVVALTKKKEF